MIDFREYGGYLLLHYESEEGVEWLDEKFKTSNEYVIRKIFHFQKLFDDSVYFEEFGKYEYSRVFSLGKLVDGYYQIDKKILDLKNDLFLSQDLNINLKTFRAERDISVFKKLDSIINEPIIIGGNHECAVPIEVFNQFISQFPSTYELNKYAEARVEQVLGEYFETMSPAGQILSDYLNRKRKTVTNSPVQRERIVLECEIHKFEYAYQELQAMLEKPDNSYQEKKWQEKVINLITLIFPKYIGAFPEVRVKDFYTKAPKSTHCEIDILLVDFNGNIDVLELKKPFENKVLSRKPSHRRNYIPNNELSTAIVQAEKYIFHLSKWGINGERDLTKKLKNKLPNNLEIKISNPKAIILCGRSNQFDNRQKLDFEIIKRQYSNIADIMTYDDLLNRIKNILDMLRKDYSQAA